MKLFIVLGLAVLIAFVQCHPASNGLEASGVEIEKLENVDFDALRDEDTNHKRQARQFCCGGGFGGFRRPYFGGGGFRRPYFGGGGFRRPFGGGFGGGSSSAAAASSSSGFGGGFFG